MSLIGVIFVACAMFGLAGLAGVPAQAADPTLAAVKKRGQLFCGINGQLPGFSAMNERKEWTGFEVEFCRAVAAATLRDATKVKFVPLTATVRFDALRSGQIDVLARNSVVTLAHTARTGVRDAVVIYIDGQAVALPKKPGTTALTRKTGSTIASSASSP